MVVLLLALTRLGLCTILSSMLLPLGFVSLDPLRFSGMIMNANMDAREVESSGIDTHEQGGGQALLVVELVGAAPAMAKGTASIEPTGRAEKATTVKLEALEPGAYGKAGSRCKWSLQAL